MKREPFLSGVLIFALLLTAACRSNQSHASQVTTGARPFVTRGELVRAFSKNRIPIVLDFDYTQFDPRYAELASFAAKDPRIGTRLEVFQCRNARLAKFVSGNFSRIFSQTRDRVVLTRINIVIVFDPSLKQATKAAIRSAVRSLA
jgi:hypothetical protein